MIKKKDLYELLDEAGAIMNQLKEAKREIFLTKKQYRVANESIAFMD